MAARQGLANLLDRLAAGETLPAGAAAARAHRLFLAGRRAIAAPVASQKLLRRALRIFRDERKRSSAPSVLRLVLDSLVRAAPAVRTGATKRDRFLRFEGAVTVELAVIAKARGVELRGQVLPADAVKSVSIGGKRVPVETDGTFVARNVPRGPTEIAVGAAKITGLTL